MLADLSSLVTSLDLPRGIEQSLLAELEAAGSAVDRGDESAAIGQLGAFMHHVDAQRGHHIDDADADALITAAEAIIDSLRSGGARFAGGGEEMLEPVTRTGSPDTVRLSASAPNPFDHSTTIRFALPQLSSTTIGVYDVTGRLVRVLTNDPWPQGQHAVSWDGRDRAGLRVSGGTYFVKLTAGDVTRTGKVVFLGGR